MTNGEARAKAHEVCALLDSWCRECGNGNQHSAVCDAHTDLILAHASECDELRAALADKTRQLTELTTADGTNRWVGEKERELIVDLRARLAETREAVFTEIRTALSCVTGFRPAALKVEEWKAISDRFPENAAAGTETPKGEAP